MTAAVVAESTGGRTRCTTLRSAPPISLRDTQDGLYLVASGAGPIGGDELDLDIDVGPGAFLVVRSAGASMVLPGPHGGRSSLRVRARAQGSLRWEPEPTILVAGCDHRTSTTIELSATACLLWREVVVLGRHREPSGSILQRLHVNREGVPLLRNELAAGPRWPGADGPAGTDGARVVTSVLVVGFAAPTVPAGFDGAVAQLSDDAWMMTSLSARRPSRSAPDSPGPRREAVAVR